MQTKTVCRSKFIRPDAQQASRASSSAPHASAAGQAQPGPQRLASLTGFHSWFCILLALLLAAPGASSRAVEPLIRAHAHNDYLHLRPLRDALDHGFWSVEADVWLTNGQLLVAHDLDKALASRTLEKLYLDPLRRFTASNAPLFATAGPITLLIDFKSEATNTWRVLRETLGRYDDILTRFTGTTIQPNKVTVIISGNRPTELMADEPVRFAAIDGRLPDLSSATPAALMPLVSDNWTKHFGWNARGPLPAEEHTRLRLLVASAHAQGRRIRFWGVPDVQAAWHELREAGVDLINTDQLGELEWFLRNR